MCDLWWRVKLPWYYVDYVVCPCSMEMIIYPIKCKNQHRCCRPCYEEWGCHQLLTSDRVRIIIIIVITSLPKVIWEEGRLAHVRRKVPIAYNGAPQICPQKYPFAWTDPHTPLPAWSLDPFDLWCQTASGSDAPFFHNALDRQTDRPTDRSPESLMTTGRCATRATRPNNNKKRNYRRDSARCAKRPFSLTQGHPLLCQLTRHDFLHCVSKKFPPLNSL